MAKINTFDIRINDEGVGQVNFEANGFLETLIVPENFISTYNILCVNTDEPLDIVCDIRQSKGGLFSLRRRVHRIDGFPAESDYDKMYMNGTYTMRITGASPGLTLKIILVVN